MKTPSIKYQICNTNILGHNNLKLMFMISYMHNVPPLSFSTNILFPFLLEHLVVNFWMFSFLSTLARSMCMRYTYEHLYILCQRLNSAQSDITFQLNVWLSSAVLKYNMMKAGGSHGVEYIDDDFLGCDAVWACT